MKPLWELIISFTKSFTPEKAQGLCSWVASQVVESLDTHTVTVSVKYLVMLQWDDRELSRDISDVSKYPRIHRHMFRNECVDLLFTSHSSVSQRCLLSVPLLCYTQDGNTHARTAELGNSPTLLMCVFLQLCRNKPLPQSGRPPSPLKETRFRLGPHPNTANKPFHSV